MTGHASASRVVAASPDDVFDTITDIGRLPDWNDAITAVIEELDELEVGAQWVVGMHAFGQSWHSRSTVEVSDPTGRCFAYRSATDDGNPSYALWTWVVTGHADGALVTVACELHPRTFWRRVLFVRIRARQLARFELPQSLAALEAATRPRRVGEGTSRDERTLFGSTRAAVRRSSAWPATLSPGWVITALMRRRGADHSGGTTSGTRPRIARRQPV